VLKSDISLEYEREKLGRKGFIYLGRCRRIVFFNKYISEMDLVQNNLMGERRGIDRE